METANNNYENEALDTMNIEIDANRPQWIDPVEVYDIASIQQGGCASGAYMPAVTYYTATQTMADHGNDILDYIEEQTGENPLNIQKPDDVVSWSGLACFYVSYAVELWAMQFDIDGIEY